MRRYLATLTRMWGGCWLGRVLTETADLGCLDHTYFVVEIRRLQSRAQAVRERVSSSAFGCQRSTTLAQADQAYMALMEIVCSLDDYLQEMQVGSRCRVNPSTRMLAEPSLRDPCVAQHTGKRTRPRLAAYRGSTGLKGVLTCPARLASRRWGATSFREAAPLTVFARLFSSLWS